MSEMNPVKTAKNITDSYYRYIMTRFPFGKTNPKLQKRFKELLYSPAGKEKLIKGPIIEITPPYTKGKSLNDLSKEFPEWVKLKEAFEANNSYDTNRPLFKHQEKALIKSLKHNIVVASGTGSGKTESFLFPIFRYCIENPGKGVRAIMIYPLNALIEDQIQRLSNYLKGTNITYGKYTGQTPNTKKDADKNEKKSENHIITREEMRESPPNILITNYAMLEYILLRPGDSAITDIRDEHAFKFIILDEAHTYTGAQGTEVAYLLKRLRHRVGRQTEDIRCIATSATLGDGKIDFAERLFGARFSEENLIIGEKELISDNFSIGNDYELNHDDILKWCIPNENLTIQDIKNKFNIDVTSNNLKMEVFKFLENKKPVRQIIKLLEEKPLPVKELAQKIFTNHPQADEILVNLVAWSDYGQNSSKLSLIPARYHMLISAPKGLFCSLNSNREIQDIAMSQNDIQNFCPFELSVCKTCGEPYIIGLSYLEAEKQRYKAVSESFFEAKTKVEETSDVILMFKNSEKYNSVNICTICGIFENACEHSPEDSITLYKYNPEFSETNNVSDDGFENDNIDEKGCVNCGTGNKLENQLVSLVLPPNGSTSILASALYTESPEMSNEEIEKNNEYFNEIYGEGNKDWSSIVEKGKKLIVFSDSRQDAAFFGPYLQVSHNQLVFNRMVYQILKKKGEALELPDLVSIISSRTDKMLKDKEKVALFLKDLRPNTSEDNFFKKEMILKSGKKKRIYHSVLSLIDGKGAFLSGIEGLGLGLAYFDLDELKVNIDGLYIDKHNIIAISQLLLFYCRQRQAFNLSLEDGDINLEDQEDAYYNGRYKFNILKRQDDSNKEIDNVVRLISKKPNSFQHLVRHAINKLTGEQVGWEQINELILRIADELSRNGTLQKDSKSISYYLDIDKIYLLAIPENGVFPEEIPGGMNKFKSCKRCGRISWINIGMCNFSKCYGELEDFNNSFQSSQLNHYRNWLIGEEKPELRAVEHTAQLDKRTSAKSYQNEFKLGRINVLSSSTTFEMGVDLGDLSVVFMRNVPPGVANYIQRAGRAGRRPGISPFVLTYCRNLPHDQYFFNNYDILVSGKVNSPAIVLENKKIALRHYNAVVLSEFFKSFPQIFNNSSSGYINDPLCKNLFEINDSFGENMSSADYISDKWLKLKWLDFQKSFKEIFYDSNIGKDFFESSLENYVYNFGYHKKYGLISSLNKDFRETIEYYVNERNKYNPNILKEQTDYNFFNRLIKQTNEEKIISHLSSRGFLPSYAFPTDVVPLKILSQEKSEGVDLTRELGRAISEYAPDSQVIANSRLYTSQALHKFPKQEFKVYTYFNCLGCKAFFIDENKDKVMEFKESHELCLGNEDNNTINAIYPQWGFAITRGEKGKKIRINTKRKAKAYIGDLFISEKEKDDYTDHKVIKFFNGFSLSLKYISGYNMYRINRNKYKICADCGMSLPIEKKNKKNPSHEKLYEKKNCENSREVKANLVSIFDTDVVRLAFENVPPPLSDKSTPNETGNFWLSLLYAILESISRVMEIERKDIDGLYKIYNNSKMAELILIDSVSGGAGHVARLLGRGNEIPEELIRKILLEAKKISDCQFCNENTACYSCLFHYSNQKSQHLLNRGVVFNWLNKII